MKTLDSFDFGRQSRKTAYDWDSILDGKIHVLEEGKDFTCKPATMRSRARTIAAKMGLGVRVGSTKDGDVVIQSIPLNDEDDDFAKAVKGDAEPEVDIDTDDADGSDDDEEEEEEVKKPARRSRRKKSS